MCICWCVTEINYRMHGATMKVVSAQDRKCTYNVILKGVRAKIVAAERQ